MKLGAIILLTLIAVAVFAPYLAPHPPARQVLGDRLSPPGSPGYLLGTDAYGRDILSRMIYGARISLQVGITAVSIAVISGSVVGLLAGYYGGWFDLLVMRVVDVMLAFPTILMALAFIAILGPALMNVMIAVGVTMSPHYARVVRSSVLSLREKEFTEAARAAGARDFRIMFQHIMLNSLTPIMVMATLGAGTAILVEASLSFLGLGVPPPTPTWGITISEGRRWLMTAPWVSLVPGVAIMITVLGLNLLGDGLRDTLDPRIQ